MIDNAAAAAEIDAARRTGSLVELFTSRFGPIDLATAYAIAALGADLRGGTRVGRKIGFTNRTIWDRYGVHHPIWGWMYDDTVKVHGPGDEATIDVSQFVQPRLEPEIVMRLARPVPAGATIEAAAAAVEWIAFGYEIVHTHFAGWLFQAADTVIDAALHGASRVGVPHEPWPSMAADLASFSLTLHRDGAAIGEGRGEHVLGSPLHALVHLADVIGVVPAGEIITTGTITNAVPIAAGERYHVEIVGLPVQPLALSTH
jgi:2-oxo-3-hexenedioate decarboxylase